MKASVALSVTPTGFITPPSFGLPPKLGYIGSCCEIDEIPPFVTIAVYNEFRNFASPSEG